MKKILQRSLSRLHTLLLLAVMFVVGASAWAETVTFTTNDVKGKSSVTIDDVTVEFVGVSPTTMSGYAIISAGYQWKVTSATKDIVSVKMIGMDGYCGFSSTSGGTVTEDGGTITWTPEGSTKVGNFKFPSSGSYFTAIEVELEGGATGGGGETGGETGGGSGSGQAGATVELDLSATTGSVSVSDVTASYTYSSVSKAAYITPLAPLTITSADANILKIELVGSSLASVSSSPAGISGGVWTGSAKSVTFGFSGMPWEGASVTKAIVTLEATTPATPIDYTISVTGAPEGASVTLDDKTYGNGTTTYSVAKTFKKEDLTATDTDDYYATVDYTESNHTFTVTYTAYTKYTVILAEGSEYQGNEAGVVVDGTFYGVGSTIKSKGSLTSIPVAKEVQLYEGTATPAGSTIVLNYTRKVLPPFDITSFNPANNAKVANINRIMFYPPSGKYFVKEDNVKPVTLTFTDANDESNSFTVNAYYTCNYEAYAYVDPSPAFTTPGTWKVTIPAGIATTTEGALNNAATVTYTIIAPAKLVSATPAAGSTLSNLTVDGTNFTLTFDKNVKDSEGYYINVNFPDGASITVPTINQYGRILNVNVNGNTLTFEPLTNFWKVYGSHLQKNGNFGFSIAPGGVTDADNIANDSYITVSYPFTYEAPTSAMTGAYPEVGNVSLDDTRDGISYFTIYFEDALDGNPYFSSDGALPEGMSFTTPDGVTFYQIYGNNGNSTLYGYVEGGKTPGEYHLQIPKGTLNFQGGKTNAAIDLTWTVTPATKFSFDSYSVQPRTGEVESLNTITISAPYGVTFTEDTQSVAILVNGDEFATTATITANAVTINCGLTEAGSYSITIPAGTFTSADGLTNKVLSNLNYTILPTLAINENAVDAEDNTWTTFCLGKSFTLEAGYTPYIVVDNGEGGIALKELVGTPKTEALNVYFTAKDEVPAATLSGNTITSTDVEGKYEITYQLGSRSDWANWNGCDYMDINDATYVYVTVLNPAFNPSNVVTLGYDCSYTVDSSISQDGNYITIVLTGGTLGGLRFELPSDEFNAPIVPANTGILVKGAAKTGIKYTAASGTTANVDGNKLVGCTQSGTLSYESKYVYKLAWENDSYDNFGFYWGSEDGHSVDAHAGKAYLVLDEAPASNSNRILLFGGDAGLATGIDSVLAPADNAPVYNLQGKRVSRENLPAGVYVTNGRKFIVK